MKNKKFILALSLLLVTLASTVGVAFADDTIICQPIGQGFGRDNITDGRYASTLTEEDMVTIEGKVEDLNTTTPPFSFTLKYDDKDVSIHLGRIVFTDEFEKLNLENGDDVQVKGFYRTYKINDEDMTVLAPVVIKSGDKTLNLRDEYNRPIWAGKGNRNRGNGLRRGKN